MLSLYKLKNRISAFIFLENRFVQAETHTLCVIDILKSEKIVKDERDFNKQMRDKFTKTYIEHLTSEIENQSIFGEIAIHNGRVSLIVFDRLNRYGLDSIKAKSKEVFGDVPIYYLNLNTTNRVLMELY